MGSWNAHFWDNYPVPHQKMSCLFLSIPTYFFNMMVSSTRKKEGNVLFNDALNTFYLWLYGVGHMVKDLLLKHHLTSQEFIGHIQNHFITTNPFTCHQWHSRFYKMLYQMLVASRPLPWQHATVFGRLQPVSKARFTYGLVRAAAQGPQD